MGLKSWWNDGADKANDINLIEEIARLNTGVYNDVYLTEEIDPLNTGLYEPLNSDPRGSGGGNLPQFNGCATSAQCPAGYACVNGRCTPMSTGPTGGSSNGQWNSAGGCNQNDPNSPCNSGGPYSCSQTPNCGDTPNPRPEDCCGDRCCSFGEMVAGQRRVNCYCGKCSPWPKEKTCSIFCDGYTAANGESVMGCSSENSCNECNVCDLFSKSCEPQGDGPCWCPGSQCQDCRKCDTTTTSPDFGSCIPAGFGACSICTHVDSYKCPCGETVGPITACSKYDSTNGSGYGGNVILTNKTALQIAQEQCAPASSCDPCKGDCTTKSYCSDTTGPAPDCPPGIKCTETGTLSAGGVDCTFREECDMSNVPESCKDCDCNCNNDCNECEICAADGTCQPDPNCEEARSTWFKASIPYIYEGCSYNQEVGAGGCIDLGSSGDAATSEVNVTTTCGPLPHTIVQTQGMDQAPYGPCVIGNTTTCWRVQDADGNWITSEFCQGGVSGTFCSDLDTSEPPTISEYSEC